MSVGGSELEESEGKRFASSQALRGLYQAVENENEIPSPAFVKLKSTLERYTDKTLIGRGATKQVYKCFDQLTKKFIAYAIPQDELDISFYDSFVYEVWLTSALNHPNIIKIYDVGVTSTEQPYFTMNLKSNTTLADEVGKKRSRVDLLNLYLKICDAIVYAHSQKIIHLDLKPDNIQCDQYGEVIVCDWGIAKKVEVDKSMPERSYDAGNLDLYQSATLHGQIKGSLGYMAPEQASVGGHKDYRTDVFSLGAILYFILAGRSPFEGDKNEIIFATQQGDFDPLDKSIPVGLRAITKQALACKAEDRYQSVLELQLDVKNYLQGFPTNAEGSSMGRRISLFFTRHKTKIVLIIAPILLLVAMFLRYQDTIISKERLLLLEKEKIMEQEHETDVLMKYVFQDQEVSRGLGILGHQLLQVGPDAKKIVENLDDAELILLKSFEENESSLLARAQLFYLLCVKLNFNEALSLAEETQFPVGMEHTYKLLRLAQKFPDFKYDASVRPSSHAFKRFLDVVEQDPDNYPRFVEHVFTYDLLKGNGGNNSILSFLDYLNTAAVGLKHEYNLRENSIVITSQKPFRYRRLLHSKSVLSYLNLAKLKISVSYLNAEMLDGAEVNSLDLSQVKNLKIAPNPQIKGLQKLTLSTEHKKSGIDENYFSENCEFSLEFK